MKVVAVAHGWNEAENLPKALKSTNEQRNISFSAKVYVDDGSTDGSADIAEGLGWDVVRLKWIHENLVETAWIPIVFNKGLERLYNLVDDFDFLLVAPCDIMLPPNYVYTITRKMQKEKRVKVASGTIKDEPCHPQSPRGAGRIYDGKFFLQHVKFFPRSVIWETWALVKAFSLGYECKTYYDRELVMTALRPTRFWKPFEGYAMRKLGYFPPYALSRMALACIQNPKRGVKAFSYYLKARFDEDLVDERMKNWFRYSQSKTLFNRVFGIVKGGFKR